MVSFYGNYQKRKLYKNASPDCFQKRYFLTIIYYYVIHQIIPNPINPYVNYSKRKIGFFQHPINPYITYPKKEISLHQPSRTHSPF